MKNKNLLQRLEKIYRKLSVKFPYPQVPWNNIFSIPDTNKLVSEFIKRAAEVDIQVEVIENSDDLNRRIESIFETYKKVWVDRNLKSSFFFKDQPVTANQWGAQAGITTCRALIARTGSIVIDSTHQGRQAGLTAPYHFIIARKKQLYPDLYHFFAEINRAEALPSSISIISGPSRTADIEKKLVKGAHGPETVTVLLLT